MRNEQGMTLATVIVLLCCMSALTNAAQASSTRHSVTQLVIDAYPSFNAEPTSDSLDAPERTSLCILHCFLPRQIEIEELHNLPPPSGFEV